MGLHKMAGVTGLEPAASGVTGRRSNQLSYTPLNLGDAEQTASSRSVWRRHWNKAAGQDCQAFTAKKRQQKSERLISRLVPPLLSECGRPAAFVMLCFTATDAGPPQPE